MSNLSRNRTRGFPYTGKELDQSNTIYKVKQNCRIALVKVVRAPESHRNKLVTPWYRQFFSNITRLTGAFMVFWAYRVIRLKESAGRR